MTAVSVEALAEGKRQSRKDRSRRPAESARGHSCETVLTSIFRFYISVAVRNLLRETVLAAARSGGSS